MFTKFDNPATLDLASVRYAGFLPRLAASLLDAVFFAAFCFLCHIGGFAWRLFFLYFFIPRTVFMLFYNIYLVRRLGGTPGKLLLKICIRKANGEPVGYKEAAIRYLPYFIFPTLASIAFLYPLMHMTNAEYQAIPYMKLERHLLALVPPWYKYLDWACMVWSSADCLVFLANKKRRSLHDFIAGTIVVHLPPKEIEVSERIAK